MSELFPIIAVTGSSGAGTSSVRAVFEHMFENLGVTAATIEGDAFHRYDRAEMAWQVERAALEGQTLTHFGPQGNLFDALDSLFRSYGEAGTGRARHYVHTEEEASLYGVRAGMFTDWQPLSAGTDLLFYEGLHGGLVTAQYDFASAMDLLVGVVPIINLEWIQKIYRDQAVRGYTTGAATNMILRRMPDYVHYICPQFSRTDINFQRVPTIDTANPFVHEQIPSNDESLVVIHVANEEKINPDFGELLAAIEGAFLSRPNTLVIPAAGNDEAMELLLQPVLTRLIEQRDRR